MALGTRFHPSTVDTYNLGVPLQEGKKKKKKIENMCYFVQFASDTCRNEGTSGDKVGTTGEVKFHLATLRPRSTRERSRSLPPSTHCPITTQSLQLNASTSIIRRPMYHNSTHTGINVSGNGVTSTRLQRSQK